MEARSREGESTKKLGTPCEMVLTYWEMLAASLIVRYALPTIWRLPSDIVTHILNLYFIIV